MLTRATLPARRIKVAGIRLNKDKRRALVDRIAAAMSRSEPTAFSLEGELRHRLRSSLCRQGADWILADLLAAAIVEDALRKVGAQRPTWQQGQPEWTQEGVIYIQRTRCIRCRWKLPPGHRKYCSQLCAQAHLHALERRFNAADGRAFAYAPR